MKSYKNNRNTRIKNLTAESFSILSFQLWVEAEESQSCYLLQFSLITLKKKKKKPVFPSAMSI